MLIVNEDSDLDYVRRQVLSSRNVRPHPLVDFLFGGLNYQIEHHLFPRVCHVHYRQLSPIVERLAAKHGVPYHSSPTLWQAIRSHYRVLKRLGDPAYAPPARTPVVWAEPVRG
jgi:linoleoyl-CoA desaturase